MKPKSSILSTSSKLFPLKNPANYLYTTLSFADRNCARPRRSSPGLSFVAVAERHSGMRSLQTFSAGLTNVSCNVFLRFGLPLSEGHGSRLQEGKNAPT